MLRHPKGTLVTFLVLAAALTLPVALRAIVPINSGTPSVFSAVLISACPALSGIPCPGDQFDPHVDGDIASYTDGDHLRYYNFATGDDLAVSSGPDDIDQLSDVSNGRIAFTRLDATSNLRIFVFDTATQTADEIDPQPGVLLRINPAIGSDTVAYIDLGLAAVTGELVVTEIGGATTPVTTDARFERSPSVAPLGDVVVYESCQTVATNCDVRQATRVGAAWVVTNLTNNAEPESNPDTDGTVVVYDADRSGEQDIFWQPVGGGAEQRLELPGVQRNPSISGGLIAFESVAVGETAADLFVYHIATNRLFRITTTPTDDTLNDVSALPTDQFRVVWSSGVSPNRDVFGATFELPDVVDDFDFGGFLQPVDPYPTLNTMKAGAAVPVKFSLGGFQGLDIFAAGYPKSQTIPCGSTALEDGIEQTVTAGNSSLSYDATSDRYSYVWKTDKAWANTCRQLVVKFTDDSIYYANFKFK